MTAYVKGTDLSPNQRRHVLAAYVHRFTGDHVPSWAMQPRQDGTKYPLQFRDDDDWLAHTSFPIKKNGDLAKQPSCCRSAPTWPKENQP